ncbi:hypothetical protein RFI_05127 [Reticulomyxa filosa]|uniref:Uncharacterized protein n=1 Tax=Reticulomyxa filosa TaxID=46433 RepID=X6P180_RETFI|nr:hypothetical protein RFI_05127 [Reticulomyxa filosa]|eukprot:ETO31991.1 hypothetical protein RFI_05127 [Reticulomyxa filosa]
MRGSHGAIADNDMMGSVYSTKHDDVVSKYPMSTATGASGGVVSNFKNFLVTHTPQGFLRAKAPISKLLNRFGMTPASQQTKPPTYNAFATTGNNNELNDATNYKNQKSTDTTKPKMFDQPINGLRADEYGNVQYSNPMQTGRDITRPQGSHDIFTDQRKNDPLDMLKNKSIPQLGLHPKWNSHYSDLARQLYRDLGIGANILEWAESSKWVRIKQNNNRSLLSYISSLCQQRHKLWEKTNEMVELLVAQLRQWYPNSKQNFDALVNVYAKSQFLVDNYKQMQQVAKEKDMPKICEFVEKRKQVIECVGKLLLTTKNRNSQSIDLWKELSTPEQSSKYQYLIQKIQMFGKNQWNLYDLLKTDPKCNYLTSSYIIMNLFVQYMDDVLCPGLDLFRAKHYLEISLSEMNNLTSYKNTFKDVAIVCVQQHNPTIVHLQEQDNKYMCLPPFFLLTFNAIPISLKRFF